MLTQHSHNRLIVIAGIYINIKKIALAAGLLFVIILNGCNHHSSPPETAMSLNTLVSRMTNITAFAEAPTGQSYLTSSYDRRGGNQDWAVWTKGNKNR